MKTKSKINEKQRKQKHGVSLIVLVITIIVMIILAATVIISLTNNGIIGKANEAVEKTNLAQAKNIAALAWSETYMYIVEDRAVTEEDITTLTTAITTALTNNKLNPNDYKITVTLTGVTVEEKDEVEWVDILTTPVTTEEGGALISEDNIFIDGYTYRITIEGPEYNGEFVCKAMYVETSEDLGTTYALIDIGSVEQPTWETYADVEKLTENSIKFYAMGISAQGIGSGIIFQGITDAHTITKIEGLKPKVVYENEEKTATPEILEIEELNIQRNYIIEVEYEGTKYYFTQFSVTGCPGLFGRGTVEPCALYANTSLGYIVLYNGAIQTNSAIVTAVYDIGINPSGVIYENGFCIVEMQINKITGETIYGYLIQTPGGEYTIPEMVGDVKVQVIERPIMNGTVVTITHNVTISADDHGYVDKIIIKKTADQMLYEDMYFVTVDVTDFGDDVVLTEEWLNEPDITVIVTENAKKNLYATNEKVLAAE